MSNLALDDVLNEVRAERDYQEAKWSPSFDDKNTANDWVSYIGRYCANASKFDLTQDEFETAMVKVAALAVAAVETSRRNSGPAVRHYDA